MRRLARWCGVLGVVGLVVLSGASFLTRTRAAGHLRVADRAQGVASAAPVTAIEISGTTDSFGDGTPDFLRLHDSADRGSFRRWFALIAESQYYRRSNLPPEVKDCAGLLRFSYHEALRRHDSTWASAMSLPIRPSAGEITQYQYPYTRVRANLFRVRDGEFRPSDLKTGAFAEFADAKSLWLHNSYLVGHDLRSARPGDVLFFRQAGHDLPFHAMIFLGRSQVEPGKERFVVYHTGPRGHEPGELRRLSMAELMNYPDARWRPVPTNPSFLGVYRWNILRGDE